MDGDDGSQKDSSAHEHAKSREVAHDTRRPTARRRWVATSPYLSADLKYEKEGDHTGGEEQRGERDPASPEHEPRGL